MSPRSRRHRRHLLRPPHGHPCDRTEAPASRGMRFRGIALISARRVQTSAFAARTSLHTFRYGSCGRDSDRWRSVGDAGWIRVHGYQDLWARPGAKASDAYVITQAGGSNDGHHFRFDNRLSGLSVRHSSVRSARHSDLVLDRAVPGPGTDRGDRRRGTWVPPRSSLRLWRR